ncbi:hypothetical protein QTP88_014228 [Uroleucon formosanum]
MGLAQWYGNRIKKPLIKKLRDKKAMDKKDTDLLFEFSQVYGYNVYRLQHNNPVEKHSHNHLPDTGEINVTKCI